MHKDRDRTSKAGTSLCLPLLEENKEPIWEIQANKAVAHCPGNRAASLDGSRQVIDSLRDPEHNVAISKSALQARDVSRIVASGGELRAYLGNPE